MRAISFSVAAMVLFAVGITIFWPGRNAAPGPSAAVAQDPAATPDEADPTATPPTAASAAPSSDGESSITEKLNQKLPIDFEDVPLNDVMKSLEERTGLAFYVNRKKLEEAGVVEDTPIYLHFQSIRLSTFLELMLDGLNLSYCVKDDLIVITTPEDAESNMEIRVYDCRDLLALPSVKQINRKTEGEAADEIPKLPGDKGGASNEGSEDVEPPKDVQRRTNEELLIDLITINVNPQAWDEVGGPGSISAYHGLIVVAQPAQVHKKIERLLDMLREAAGLEVPQSGKVVR